MNIDQLYQQKTNEFELNHSNQEMHWQQMQQQIKKLKQQRLYKRAALLSTALLVASFFIVPLFTKKDNITASNDQPVLQENTQQLKAETNIPQTPVVENTAPVKPTAPKTEKTIVTPPTNKTTENNTIQKEANFYIDLSKEPQLFELDAQAGGTFTCKQGTVITIPAGAVIDSKNNAVKDKISLIVQEYYRYDDATATTADAGMVKYELYKNDEKLLVEPGKTVGIKMQNDITNIKVLNESDALPEKKLQQLSWATSDRFYTDQRTKIDYKIALAKKYNANTFMSQLVFPKYNVALPGSIDKNNLYFSSIPVGETIYFISLGKVGDKYFSCSKKLISGNTQIKEIDFIEISETLYKQQIELYSKLGKGE